MIKKSKLFLLFFFLIVFCSNEKIQAVVGTNVLTCEYDAQEITVQITLPTGDKFNPTKIEDKKYSVTDKYTAKLNVIHNKSSSTFFNEVFLIEDGSEKKKEIKNWESNKKKGDITLNAVRDKVTLDYSCPKYLNITKGKDVVAGYDANELYQYGKEFGKLNEKFYVLTLKNQQRNENVCFYHKEGDTLNSGYENLSVYYNLENKSIVSYPTRGMKEKNYEGSTCPAAMIQEDSGNNYFTWKIVETEEEVKNIYNSADKNKLLFHYRVEGDTLQSSEIEVDEIRNILIDYTNRINADVNDFEQKCVLNKELTNSIYNTCVKRKKTPNSKYYYDQSLKKIEYAMQTGIPETDEVIVNLKNAMNRYETIILNATLNPIDIVQKLYCEYESQADSKYMILEKECPLSSNITMCTYNFKIYDNKSSMNLIHDYDYGKVNNEGKNYCFDSKMIYVQSDSKFNCYENLYYDIDNDQVKFASDNMISKLRAGTPWDKKFTLIGIKQSKTLESTFENAETVSNIESMKIHNNGFMFNDNSSCIDSISGTIECEDIFDEEMKDFISFAYFIIEIIAIVLVIIMSVKDYAGVIINGDQDGIKKCNGKLIKRLLLVVLLLLLPAIIRFTLKIFDIEYFDSKNPTCGIEINK